MKPSGQLIRTTGVGLAVIAFAACGSDQITPATSAGATTSLPVATSTATTNAGASATVTATSTITSTVSVPASTSTRSATTLTPGTSPSHLFTATRTSSASALRTPSASASGLPVLGLASAYPSSVVGIGTVRPHEINFAGDGTSYITNVTWSTWGGSHADGYGTANWVAANASSADSVPLRAHVRAYDLGTCGGRRAYRRLVWWWPSKGDTFAKAVAEGDGYHVCTGY